ncbi:hypothetical protein EV424DRAFT_1062700 [Suillus variegatus]|nr:hypothetical protein EV424DRAFT_1062700 [Suillus variegatus]
MTSTMLKLRTVPNCVHPISRPSVGQFHCLADDLHPLSLTFFLGHVNLGFISAFSCLMLSCLTRRALCMAWHLGILIQLLSYTVCYCNIFSMASAWLQTHVPSTAIILHVVRLQ